MNHINGMYKYNVPNKLSINEVGRTLPKPHVCVWTIEFKSFYFTSMSRKWSSGRTLWDHEWNIDLLMKQTKNIFSGSSTDYIYEMMSIVSSEVLTTKQDNSWGNEPFLIVDLDICCHLCRQLCLSRMSQEEICQAQTQIRGSRSL